MDFIEFLTKLAELITELLPLLSGGIIGRKVIKSQEGKDKNGAKSRFKLYLGAICVFAIAVVVTFLISYLWKVTSYEKEGKELYYSQYHSIEDNVAARELFEKAAEKGKEDAYYFLGGLDMRDFDYESAYSNYEKGTQEGSTLAKLGLVNLYMNGYGVSADPEKALLLCEEALETGCVEANYYMGLFTKIGMAGLVHDNVKALEYFELAAQSEELEISTLALENIAAIHINGGLGVEEDLEKAIVYYEQAIERNPYSAKDAYYNIGSAYAESGENVLAEDYYRKTYNFLEEAVKGGDTDSLCLMGILYRQGKGLEADGEAAVEWYKKAADAGNVIALYNIGFMYEYGYANVIQNEKKAKEWYYKAADKGYDKAMNHIASMYYDGRMDEEGGKPDYNTAFQWYKKAADAGSGSAYVSMGDLCRDGKGKEQDYSVALEYYQKALIYGNKSAYNRIAAIYYKGQGIDKPDYEEALEWYKKGAQVEESTCMYVLGTMYYQGLGMGHPDYQRAEEWLLKASDAGNKNTWYYLGQLYSNQKADRLDYQEALKWYEKAAKDGNSNSMYAIGWLYADGRLGEENYQEALKWFQKAAEVGNGYAIYYIGWFYENGKLGEADYQEALKWYQKGAEVGNSDSIYAVGWLYANGKLGEADYEEALKWYEKAAEAGNHRGMNAIANIYYNGELGEVNYQEALKWYEKAAEAGNSKAMNMIGIIYHKGYVGESDYQKALDWYLKAAENGNIYAIFNAGLVYESWGEHEKALQMYGRAIDNGYEDVDKVKGFIQKMLDNGYITQEDASKWLK